MDRETLQDVSTSGYGRSEAKNVTYNLCCARSRASEMGAADRLLSVSNSV